MPERGESMGTATCEAGLARGEAPLPPLQRMCKSCQCLTLFLEDEQCCAARAGKDARGLLTAHQAKGAGYAISRPEELQTVIEVAESTGAFSIASQLCAHHCSPSVRGIGDALHRSEDKQHASLNHAMRLCSNIDQGLCCNVAGLIFDSTYSGKAFHALREDIRQDPAHWKGRKVVSLLRLSPSAECASQGQILMLNTTSQTDVFCF